MRAQPPGALVGVGVRVKLAGNGAGVGHDIAALVIGAGQGADLIGQAGDTPDGRSVARACAVVGDRDIQGAVCRIGAGQQAVERVIGRA